ncbi:MAG: PepSY domain-containing protein [Clostridia bacterium]|nr:PepSY domain-containing protein [Clostridia bacterium]
MKRAFTAALAAASLSALLLTGCAGQEQHLGFIGTEKAKNIALEESGLFATEVQFTSATLNTKNGIDYYRVAFLSHGEEYEYDIDALTGVTIDDHAGGDVPLVTDADTFAPLELPGETISVSIVPAPQPVEQAPKPAPEPQPEEPLVTDADTFEVVPPPAPESPPAEPASKEEPALPFRPPEDSLVTDADSFIQDHGTGAALPVSEREAKEAALRQAGCAESEVTFAYCRTDSEDGRQIYSIAFSDQAGNRYETEVDAATCEILSYDMDSAAPASGSILPVDKAREIALAQVPGAAAENLLELQTEHDDGRLSYEGAIRFQGTTYEFEIDGYSGAIRSWEVDDPR